MVNFVNRKGSGALKFMPQGHTIEYELVLEARTNRTMYTMYKVIWFDD